MFQTESLALCAHFFAYFSYFLTLGFCSMFGVRGLSEQSEKRRDAESQRKERESSKQQQNKSRGKMRRTAGCGLRNKNSMNSE